MNGIAGVDDTVAQSALVRRWGPLLRHCRGCSTGLSCVCSTRRRCRGFSTIVTGFLCLKVSGSPTLPVNTKIVCPRRQCLPEDDAPAEASRNLCYTSTVDFEAYAACSDSAFPSCVACSSTLPCESFCEPLSSGRALGEPCHFDRECEGADLLASCHMGLCRRVLWAGQKCNDTDSFSVCLYGRQQCIDGICAGFGTNEPCWDGYYGGYDLDCQIGWYCLNGVCVPQLPNLHSCRGRHTGECVRGHRCNLLGPRPQCTPEYSLENGVLSSNQRLCLSSHVDPRLGECAQHRPYIGDGGECRSSVDCKRDDGSYGECRCKMWWNGQGEPGFCELSVPERQRPFLISMWRLRVSHCHHEWPEDRCAAETGELQLLNSVRRERQTSVDPTLPIPSCAVGMLDFVADPSGATRWVSGRGGLWRSIVASAAIAFLGATSQLSVINTAALSTTSTPARRWPPAVLHKA